MMLKKYHNQFFVAFLGLRLIVRIKEEDDTKLVCNMVNTLHNIFSFPFNENIHRCTSVKMSLKVIYRVSINKNISFWRYKYSFTKNFPQVKIFR